MHDMTLRYPCEAHLQKQYCNEAAMRPKIPGRSEKGVYCSEVRLRTRLNTKHQHTLYSYSYQSIFLVQDY
jgi:hypothetical protein